jgi:nucleoside-diphosphate-sugar epimerase
MLLERGAKTVICFDRTTPNTILQERFTHIQTTTGGQLMYCHGPEHGDLTNKTAVERAFTMTHQQIDVVYHIAALVGPFHDKELYHAVNYVGTVTIIEMCRKYKVPKLV